MDKKDIFRVLDLMEQLPTCREENEMRLNHTLRNGHLLLLKEGEQISGCAELFRMAEAPAYPVLPWPKDNLNGRILYCFSAVTEKNRILKLIQLAKKRFSECKYIAWHREKRNHKLYLERV